MPALNQAFIRQAVADSVVIFRRGQDLYAHGAYVRKEARPEEGQFVYHVDGSYGDYTIRVQLDDAALETHCDCPYPGSGCKHVVAVLLDVRDFLQGWEPAALTPQGEVLPDVGDCLTPEEIRLQAVEDRRKRARTEAFSVCEGEMFKGQHLVETRDGKQYVVSLHDPANGTGHCTCPDYQVNRLGFCKHLIFLSAYLKKKRGFQERVRAERFPFIDIYWDSVTDCPRMFNERPSSETAAIQALLDTHFAEDGAFVGSLPQDLVAVLPQLQASKRVRIADAVLQRIDQTLEQRQMAELTACGVPDLSTIYAKLYPYQLEGVKFGLYKPAVLIGDEMGLGKTLQAIALAVLKKEIFGFAKVLVITLASLKEQWKREIERFTDELPAVVAGSPSQREAIYFGDKSLFKITNYEAVLRDVTLLSRFRPDLIILDEAQRIKNFSTKTADAVKRLPRRHAVVLTGTPLENKLEDVYSIIQFLDPRMLAPLWQFAADHFMLSRLKKGKILGYRNLELLHTKLQSIVIRRRKEDVLSDLPEQVTNNYFLDLHDQQKKIHAGYTQYLLPLLNKKFLTPMDLRRIQELLLKMRMVCNSTYLIDRKTHISPKLKELEGILDETVLQNRRKVVIFSEWTTMNFLIARHLSGAGIPFVELSGKIPVKKRQALIDEFTHNPDCKVFLSTDAGGTGLNLQAADTVINFELPWNPARLNQRIGRVNRIGQQSQCVNVVNLITKKSIEEKILAGIQLKSDLFKGVFDGGVDMVEFSHAKRTEMLNRLREMMGEEPEPPVVETRPGEEIPEDTPHFRNPEALAAAEQAVDFTAEEETVQLSEDGVDATVSETPAQDRSGTRLAEVMAGQTPEKIEAVLNSGMQFIGGLLEMATGQGIKETDADSRMVRIDRKTGEVTLKFKLPGF